MRRFALILGMLLTLAAGVWGSALAAASDWCMHEAGAPSASDEHACCRANIGESNAHHSESQETAHDAAHENSNTEDQAHVGMNCGGANAAPTPEHATAALVQRGLSCAECCAGGSHQTPATAIFVAPEQHKVKRAAASDSTSAGDLFAPARVHLSHIAATQHAPPVPAERRHILISVFLI